MHSDEFNALERVRTIKAGLAETWRQVAQRIEDGRAADSVPLVEAAIKVADELAGDFTLSDHPYCLACKGYAEMRSPVETDRQVRCQDVPEVCQGNKYGRMHPVQLLNYVKSLCKPVPVAPIHSEDCAADEPVSDPQPTPSE